MPYTPVHTFLFECRLTCLAIVFLLGFVLHGTVYAGISHQWGASVVGTCSWEGAAGQYLSARDGRTPISYEAWPQALAWLYDLRVCVRLLAGCLIHCVYTCLFAA